MISSWPWKLCWNRATPSVSYFSQMFPAKPTFTSWQAIICKLSTGAPIRNTSSTWSPSTRKLDHLNSLSDFTKPVLRFVTNFVVFSGKEFAYLTFLTFFLQTEVDEYQNYENALNALKEAQRIMSKSPESSQTTKTKILSMKLAFLIQFIDLRQVCAADPQRISQFESLLNSSGMELGILKPGNIYSTVFQLYFNHQMFNEALQTLNGMKTIMPNFMRYLNPNTVANLCSTLHIPPESYLQKSNQEGEENVDDIKEMIKSWKSCDLLQ